MSFSMTNVENLTACQGFSCVDDRCASVPGNRAELATGYVARAWMAQALPGLCAVTLEHTGSDQVALAQRPAHFTVHAIFREVFGVDRGGRRRRVVVEVKRLRGAAR